MSENIVIVAAGRTAVGNFGGTLSSLSAVDLGAAVVRGLLERSGIAPDQVDEVILGQVLAAASGQNPARQTSITAGLPEKVPAMTINKVCGSGLKAVHLAMQAVACGDAEIVIAGLPQLGYLHELCDMSGYEELIIHERNFVSQFSFEAAYLPYRQIQ